MPRWSHPLDALLAARGLLFPWLAVCVGLGIGGYFVLPREPTGWEWAGLALVWVMAVAVWRLAGARWQAPALGLVLLIELNAHTGLAYIVASLLIVGFGFALFSSPNMNAIMSSVDKRFYGIASASVGTMRLLGQMLSMGIVTLIFALYIGREQITPESYAMLIKSVRAAFVVFSCFCVGGIFFSLYRGRLRPGE